MTRSLPHLRTLEGTAVLSALVLTALGIIALAAAPDRDRPAIGLAMVGAVAAVALAALLLSRRKEATRPVRHQPAGAAQPVDEPWFPDEELDGFPMDAVRPLLRTGAPSLNSLYTAWVFARQGHGATWIEQHLGLPPRMVYLLVDAAAEHRRPTDPANP
jgi:hypothetical protein